MHKEMETLFSKIVIEKDDPQVFDGVYLVIDGVITVFSKEGWREFQKMVATTY